MELLNIVAQVLVLIGIFLWMVLKTIWNVLFLAWELVRDYSPIVAKKIWLFLKKAFAFSSKWSKRGVNWLVTKGGSSFQTGFTSVKTVLAWSYAKSKQLWPLVRKLKLPIPAQLLARTATKIHLRTGSKVFSKLSLAGMLVSFIALAFIFFPDLVFAVIPYQTEPIQSAVNESALGGNFADGNLYSTLALPEKNEYLPDGNWLVIPKTGVLTQIIESPTADHEEALKQGVWRVPDFADPTEGKNYPTILVAHKFGYLAWSNSFRRQNSFYNLDKLGIGDTFDIIWDHRKFTYEIYAGEEGKEITDYKADVVLYTCKYLNSPARIFRYARRVEY